MARPRSSIAALLRQVTEHPDDALTGRSPAVGQLAALGGDAVGPVLQVLVKALRDRCSLTRFVAVEALRARKSLRTPEAVEPLRRIVRSKQIAKQSPGQWQCAREVLARMEPGTAPEEE